MAHIGFAVLIIGALLSNARKTPISRNDDQFDLQVLDENFLNNENVLLRKHDTVRMNNYFITYRGKEKRGVNIYYNIGYYDALWNHEKGGWSRGDSLFSLEPRIQQNEKFGNVAEPDTRNYWSHDVFTHIKWADTEIHNADHPDDDFMNRILKEVKLDEVYHHDNLQIHFKDIYLLNGKDLHSEADINLNDIVVKADFEIWDIADQNRRDLLQPMFIIKDSSAVFSKASYSELLQVELDIQELSHKPNTALLSIREKEYLVMQALIFPGMNLLWLGCIIMVSGLAMVLFNRYSQSESGT